MERVLNEGTEPRIIRVDRRHVVFYVNLDGDPNATTMSKVNGLWKELPAVKSGKTFEIEDETWMVGIGLVGVNEIFDDLDEDL